MSWMLDLTGIRDSGRITKENCIALAVDSRCCENLRG